MGCLGFPVCGNGDDWPRDASHNITFRSAGNNGGTHKPLSPAENAE
jgi:hypothetical protein